jgi:predicted ABC-type ATPase
MNDGVPRLRMFAGPNGSGKTTVKLALSRPPEWFGIYINPDDLEKTIRETGRLALEPFELTTATEEIRSYFASSSFLRDAHLDQGAKEIECRGGELDFGRLTMNSYYASVLADFLRRKALEASKSFSFETVMSARDKVELLRDARRQGFRIYLYYIATEDPAINVRRIQQRVAGGGHDVPEEKIVARYHRSLALLPEAIRHTDRAYFFDTSNAESWYFAEITNGVSIELKSDEIPNWFQPIWDQNEL